MSPITKIALRRIKKNSRKSIFLTVAVLFSMLMISFFIFFELQTLAVQNPAYTAKTQGECKEKLQALKEQCGRTTDRLKPDMPFGDWLDFWYQNFSKPKIRLTTQMSYEGRIYTHIIPEIGKIPLNKLTQNDLQQFYASLKKGGRNARKNSLN